MKTSSFEDVEANYLLTDFSSSKQFTHSESLNGGGGGGVVRLEKYC